MTQFAHLHLHSQYSLLDGANRIDDVIACGGGEGDARDRPHRSRQHVRRHRVLRQGQGRRHQADHRHRGLRRAGLDARPRSAARAQQPSRAAGEERDRLQEPAQLTTKSYLEGFYYKPRIDKELLRRSSEGLIALSALPQRRGQRADPGRRRGQGHRALPRVPRHTLYSAVLGTSSESERDAASEQLLDYGFRFITGARSSATDNRSARRRCAIRTPTCRSRRRDRCG